MTKFFRLILVCAGAGTLAPLWVNFQYGNERIFQSLTEANLFLVLWPALILNLAATNPGTENPVFLFTAFMNVVLYAIIGVFVWYGLKKHKIFFVFPVLGLGFLWWYLYL